MTEASKIVAALLACEASRQQQEMIKAAPGKPPAAARDVAAELWVYFEDFLERLEQRDCGRADRSSASPLGQVPGQAPAPSR